MKKFVLILVILLLSLTPLSANNLNELNSIAKQADNLSEMQNESNNIFDANSNKDEVQNRHNVASANPFVLQNGYLLIYNNGNFELYGDDNVLVKKIKPIKVIANYKNDVFLENFYLLGGDRVEICTPDGEICEFHNIYTGKRDFVLGKKDNIFSYISGGLKNIGAVITYPVFPILFGILDLN